METNRKPTDWDALVNRVLAGNHGGNFEETKGIKVGNFYPQNGPQKFPPQARLYPYAFRLRNGDGGIFLAPVDSLTEARMRLERRYGTDLAVVTTAGKEEVRECRAC